MVSEFVTKHFYTFKTGILLNVNFTTLFMFELSNYHLFCFFRWNLFSFIFSSYLALAVKSSQLKVRPQISSLSKAIETHQGHMMACAWLLGKLYKYLLSIPINLKYRLSVCLLEYNRKYKKTGSWLFCSGALYSHCLHTAKWWEGE